MAGVAAVVSNLPAWQAGMDRAAHNLDTAYEYALGKAALHAKNELQEAGRQMTGDLRLSGVGKRGARIGVRYDIDRARSSAVSDRAFIKAWGPWQFVEADTRGHRIPKVRGRRARRRYAVLGQGLVYSRVEHPGTRGKGRYRARQKRLEPEIARIIRAAHNDAIRRTVRL